MAVAPSPDQLFEVLRLCTALAYRALDAKIMGLTVPPGQAVALQKTASLLQDYGVEWPPLLAQVLRELAREAAEPPPSEHQAEPPEEIDLRGLTLFFAGFHEKDRP